MKDKENKKGASLVEVLIVIGILIMVGLAVWAFQRNAFLLNSIMVSGFSAENDARKVVKNFASEVRTASLGNDGSYPIVEANQNSFTFFADTDSDGLKEKIRYFLSENYLKRGSIKPTGNPLVYLSQNEELKNVVSNLVNGETALFSYYDSSYDGTSVPLSTPVTVGVIRLVKITAIIDESSVRSPAPIKITTQVSIRNLKDNL